MPAKKRRYGSAAYISSSGRRVNIRDRRGARATSRSSGLKSRNALVSVPRNKLGFPQEMSTTLRYVQTSTVNPGTSTAHGFSIRANGMFDPDYNLGGLQPRGFDQYMELYEKFTVTSAKLSVTFTYNSYNGAPPGQGAVQQIQDTGAAVPAPASAICLVHKAVGTNSEQTIYQFQEHDRTKWVTITPGGEAKTVTTSLTCKEFFGKDFLVGSDGYTGTVSSDPTNPLYFHVMAGMNDPNAADKPVVIICNCILEYKCTFTEPKQLAQS